MQQLSSFRGKKKGLKSHLRGFPGAPSIVASDNPSLPHWSDAWVALAWFETTVVTSSCWPTF